jgi:YbbR domain-containing protein
MRLRDYFPDKFGWKATSLVIAVLIWFAINSNNPDGLRPVKNLVENSLKLRLPIDVKRAATDVRGFRITPRMVEVTIGGEAAHLERITESDVEVFVNLRDVTEAKSLRKKVQVFTPGYVTLIKIEPEEVSIEPVTALEAQSNHTKD